MTVEQRKEKRYRLSAPAIFRTTDAREGTGTTINIASGGVLLESDVIPPAQVELWVYLKLFDRQFLADGVIVRTATGQLAVMFRAEPLGLRELLEEIEPRGSRRVAMTMLVRIRRDSGAEAELVQPANVSRGGFGFESAQQYQLHELVWVAMHWDPNLPGSAEVESPARIVRIAPLPRWGAYSYGVEFLPA